MSQRSGRDIRQRHATAATGTAAASAAVAPAASAAAAAAASSLSAAATAAASPAAAPAASAAAAAAQPLLRPPAAAAPPPPAAAVRPPRSGALAVDLLSATESARASSSLSSSSTSPSSPPPPPTTTTSPGLSPSPSARAARRVQPQGFEPADGGGAAERHRSGSGLGSSVSHPFSAGLASVRLEGWLMKKNKRHRWKKRYVIVGDAKLFVFRDLKEAAPKLTVELLTCSVKPPFGKEGKFCFQLLTRDSEILFHCETAPEAEDWARTIQILCDEALLRTLRDRSRSRNSLSERTPREAVLELVTLAGNNTCADCGGVDPETGLPEWASVSLGVFLCIECSGVHRDMGVQWSKVRSLRLDNWDWDVVARLREAGNVAANRISEKRCSGLSIERAYPGCPPHVREKWIRAKYGCLSSDAAGEQATTQEREKLKAILLELLKLDVEFRVRVRELLMREERVNNEATDLP